MDIERFDGRFCQAVENACLKAIDSVSFEAADDPNRIPKAEICTALVQIVAKVAAAIEPIPSDVALWADEIAASLIESFSTARQAIHEDLASAA
jgi:hypothetical protein